MLMHDGMGIGASGPEDEETDDDRGDPGDPW